MLRHATPCYAMLRHAALRYTMLHYAMLICSTSYYGATRLALHHLMPHPSPLTPFTSHLTPHTSHLTPHTSHLTPHPSHLTPHHTTAQRSAARRVASNRIIRWHVHRLHEPAGPPHPDELPSPGHRINESPPSHGHAQNDDRSCSTYTCSHIHAYIHACIHTCDLIVLDMVCHVRPSNACRMRPICAITVNLLIFSLVALNQASCIFTVQTLPERRALNCPNLLTQDCQ